MTNAATMGDEDLELSPKGATGEVVNRMNEEADLDIRSWLESIGGGQSLVVRVYRKEPKIVWINGEKINIEGKCAEYEEMVDEDTIREECGGGTYKLQTFRPNKGGQYVFFKAKTIKIPGKPNLEMFNQGADEAVGAVPNGEDPKLVGQAMETLVSLIKEARSAPASPGLDPTLLELLQTPMRDNVNQLTKAQEELRKILAEKDNKILELITKPADTTGQDFIRDMWNSESKRAENLRDIHASELRQLKEWHSKEIQTIRDQHRDDLKDRSRTHDREIDIVREAGKEKLEAAKLAWESRVDGLKSQISSLERELTEIKNENAALRAKKDLTLADKAKELSEMKEVFTSMGILSSGDDEDNRKWYEKLASAVMENPEAIKTMIGGPPPQPQLPPGAQVAQQMMPPVGMPFEGPDGNAYVRQPDNTVVPYTAPQQTRRQQAAVRKAKKEKENSLVRKPTDQEIKAAITFMEGAFTAKTPPETFAQTARSSVDGAILGYIQEKGVDAFFTNVAKLESNSPLRTVKGRQFIRDVGKALFGN